MKGFAKCLMCCIHTCILKWVVCCVPSKVPSAFGYHLPFISPALLSKVLMKFTLFHSGFTVWKYFVAATLSFNLANKKYKGIAEDLAIQPPDYTKWLTVIHIWVSSLLQITLKCNCTPLTFYVQQQCSVLVQ